MRPADLAGVFAPGQSVFVPGASGEPSGLVQGFHDDPEPTRGLSITTSFVPGMNRLEAGALHPTATVSGLFMLPGLRAAQREGRYRHLPVSYAGFQASLEEGDGFDVVVVQVSPPDGRGRCSLGPAAEFMPAVLARSRGIVGVVNARVPFLRHAPSIPFDRFDRVVEIEGDIAVYDPGPLDAVALAIAGHVARFIEDGATLQVGLGKAPAALMSVLGDRRALRLHSGLLSDGALDLAEAGALDPDWRHLSCVLAGSRRLYGRAAACDLIHVAGCDQTHAPAVLNGLGRFVAVNSALEVDLFGQCNLEIAAGRAVGGPGGAPDFARAARMSRGGLSIVALPSRAPGASRIVARLSTVASLPRTDVEIVVTEHGPADLRGLSVHERAEALIAVAAPPFRGELSAQWADIAANL